MSPSAIPDPQSPPLAARRYRFVGVTLILCTAVIAGWYCLVVRSGEEDRHFERGETQVVVVNRSGLPVTLFRASKDLKGARLVSEFNTGSVWLRQGNYFLQAGSGLPALMPNGN